MITKWLMGGLGLAAAVFAGMAFWQMERADGLADENATLSRNVATFERAAEQAALAKEVAKANAKRWEKRAAEYQAALEDLTEGVEDAPLDPALRDRLNRILRTP